jgi:hypothetical protein
MPPCTHRIRQPAGDGCVVVELEKYCRQQVKCQK